MAAPRRAERLWHARLRTGLGRYGGARAVLFSLSGIAAGMGWEAGLLPGAAALLWFMLQAAVALARAQIVRKENP